MLLAAEAGAIIFSPLPALYGRPRTLDDLVSATAGRALACLGVGNDAYYKWRENE
jgi:flavin prenyltransferase